MHQYKVEVSRRFGLKILCVSLRQSSLKLWSIKAKIHPLLLGRMFRELLLLNMEVWRGDEASVSCCKFLSLLQEVREERKLTTQGLCTCKPLLQYIFFFKLTSHSILHYLWSADLWKNFDQLIMSIFIFSRYFFPVENCWVTTHCLYRDSLTLKLQTTKYFIMNYTIVVSPKVIPLFIITLSYLHRTIPIGNSCCVLAF